MSDLWLFLTVLFGGIIALLSLTLGGYVLLRIDAGRTERAIMRSSPQVYDEPNPGGGDFGSILSLLQNPEIQGFIKEAMSRNQEPPK